MVGNNIMHTQTQLKLMSMCLFSSNTYQSMMEFTSKYNVSLNFTFFNFMVPKKVYHGHADVQANNPYLFSHSIHHRLRLDTEYYST